MDRQGSRDACTIPQIGEKVCGASRQRLRTLANGAQLNEFDTQAGLKPFWIVTDENVFCSLFFGILFLYLGMI